MKRPAPAASDPRLDDFSDSTGHGNGRTRVRIARPSEPLRPPENPLDRITSVDSAPRTAPAFPDLLAIDDPPDGDSSPPTAKSPVLLAPPAPPRPAPVEQPARPVAVVDAPPMPTEALPVIGAPAAMGDPSPRVSADVEDPERAEKVERVLEPLARLRAVSRPVVFPTVRRPRVRRVTRVVRHVDTWSIFKVAFVFNLVLYVVCLTAGVLLWNVAYSTGTIDNVENFFEQFGWESFEFRGGELYHNFWVAGLFVAVALTGLAVLLATLFNLITDLVGGVRVTVLEEEVVARASSRSVPRRRPRVLAPVSGSDPDEALDRPVDGGR
jgi:hypothetical protein